RLETLGDPMRGGLGALGEKGRDEGWGMGDEVLARRGGNTQPRATPWGKDTRRQARGDALGLFLVVGARDAITNIRFDGQNLIEGILAVAAAILLFLDR